MKGNAQGSFGKGEAAYFFCPLGVLCLGMSNQIVETEGLSSFADDCGDPVNWATNFTEW